MTFAMKMGKFLVGSKVSILIGKVGIQLEDIVPEDVEVLVAGGAVGEGGHTSIITMTPTPVKEKVSDISSTLRRGT